MKNFQNDVHILSFNLVVLLLLEGYFDRNTHTQMQTKLLRSKKYGFVKLNEK